MDYQSSFEVLFKAHEDLAKEYNKDLLDLEKQISSKDNEITKLRTLFANTAVELADLKTKMAGYTSEEGSSDALGPRVKKARKNEKKTHHPIILNTTDDNQASEPIVSMILFCCII